MYDSVSEFFADTDWIAYKDPTRVSPVWKQIMVEIRTIEELAGELFIDVQVGNRNYGAPTSNDFKRGHRKSASFTPQSASNHSLQSRIASPGGHIRVSSASVATSRHVKAPTGLGAIPSEMIVSTNIQYDAMMGNINRLFEERIEFYGLIDLNKSAVLSSICKILLKVRLGDHLSF
jgi:hypothetical protein